MSYEKTLPARGRHLLLLVAILLIAANLRAPITGITPILGHIREALSLGTAEAGALTTLPLLVFAFASPFCALLARRYGLERSLFLALLLITAGGVLRSGGLVWMLFAGTAVIGMGIAIGNVLLPSLIKRDFPHRIAALTSAYALTAGVAAWLVSTVVVPIAALPGSGWNIALGAYLVLPLIAMLVWLPLLRKSTASAPAGATVTPEGKLWHSALAWQVTLFFGLNSLIYYVIVTWLPQILADAGYSAASAGSLHGISQLATAIPGMFLGALIGRLPDQRVTAGGMALTMTAALAGLMLVPQWAMLWAGLFGFGSGAVFILGLAFISLRTATVPQAVALSGMVQGVGYLIAAGAPPLIGYLRETSGSWMLPLLLLVVISLMMAACGFSAGRARQIR